MCPCWPRWREVAVRVVPPIVRLPPRVARLSVTVKVLPDATVTLPLRVLAPDEVAKVPLAGEIEIASAGSSREVLSRCQGHIAIETDCTRARREGCGASLTEIATSLDVTECIPPANLLVLTAMPPLALISLWHRQRITSIKTTVPDAELRVKHLPSRRQ